MPNPVVLNPFVFMFPVNLPIIFVPLIAAQSFAKLVSNYNFHLGLC